MIFGGYSVKEGELKRHWYQIKMSYMDGNRELFYDTACVSVVCQADILKFRQIKKSAARHMVKKPGVKPLLCNGVILITVLAYLGKFDGDAQTFREYVTESFGNWMDNFFIWAVNKVP